MAIPRDIYPLATKDHKAIPLELVKPISFYSINSGSYIDLPEAISIFYAEASMGPALLAFAASLPTVANAVAIPNAIFLPWGVSMYVAVPDNAGRRMYAVSLGTDPVIVRLQTIECWQAIDQAAMLNTRL